MLDPVDDALARLLEAGRAMTAPLDGERGALWREIGRAANGGKRFRAGLVMRTHAALGGDREEAAAQVAAAFELMHTGFLMHDDLIDHDTLRRGEPNLAAVMLDRAARRQGRARAERVALASALLAGDLLLGLAHHAFATLDVPSAVHTALQALLAETLLVSIAGELDDVTAELRDAPLAQAMTVAEAKTAMYSFQAPLRAAAILADAAPPVVEALDERGHHLGIAFQLADDLLGTFAPEEVIGKSNLSDLREGRCTTLLLQARDMPVWREISRDVGRADLDQPTAAVLRRALARSDAPGAVRAQAHVHLGAVVGEDADVLPMPVQELLRDMAGMVSAMIDLAWRHVRDASTGEENDG